MSEEQNKTVKGKKPLSNLSLAAVIVALIGFFVACIVDTKFPPDREELRFITLILGVIFSLLALFIETIRNFYEVAKTEENIREQNDKIELNVSKIKENIEKQINEIKKEVKIYPVIKRVVPEHYKKLSELIDIEESYSKLGSHYRDLFDKYVLFWFNNFIDHDLINCNRNLKDFNLIAEGVTLKDTYRFLDIAWAAVKENGSIMATSIVGSDFWQSAGRYLNFQKNLIQTKRATILRYFVFPKHRFAEISSFKEAFTLNKDHNISIRVTLLSKDEDINQYYHDYGLIDNFIAVTNTVEDKSNTIIKSHTSIDHDTTRNYITHIAGIFQNLENHHNTIKFEDHDHNLEIFINEINKKIKEMSIN